MHDNDNIKFMAAVIASGAIQVHGGNPEEIAANSIAVARQIAAQVDAVPPEEPQEAPPQPA